MNALTAQQKIYIVGGSALAALGLFIGLIICPLISQIYQESQKLFQERQTIDSFYQDWKNLTNSQKDYKKLQENLAKQNLLLKPSEEIKFITATEIIAQKTQNQESITALEKNQQAPAEGAIPATTSGDQSLDFQISLQGGFSNLIKFLIYLENDSYYNNVNSLQLSRSYTGGKEETASTNDIKSVINLSVYQQ